jgi:hypothetical protein
VLHHAYTYATTGILCYGKEFGELDNFTDTVDLKAEIEKASPDVRFQNNEDDYMIAFRRVKNFNICVYVYESDESKRLNLYKSYGLNPNVIGVRTIANILYNKAAKELSLGVLPNDETLKSLKPKADGNGEEDNEDGEDEEPAEDGEEDNEGG